jgi:enoyl-CoA hydratase/carnithine racemase
MSGGLTLAAARDIVLTASSAKWGLPEVPIRLFPAWGIGSVVRRVGVTSARRLAFGTDTLVGREVHALGLADEVIGGDVLAAASKRAEALAAPPSAQTQAVKRYFATYCADEAADIAANSLFIDLSGSPEARATFQSFSTTDRTDHSVAE